MTITAQIYDALWILVLRVDSLESAFWFNLADLRIRVKTHVL